MVLLHQIRLVEITLNEVMFRGSRTINFTLLLCINPVSTSQSDLGNQYRKYGGITGLLAALLCAHLICQHDEDPVSDKELVNMLQHTLN